MDYQTVLDSAPLPILIYQDGRFVYCNRAGFDLFRYSGYDHDMDSLRRSDPWALVVPEEREEGQRQMEELLASGRELRNVPRTCVDAHGHRVETLISATLSEWDGRPAVELSYTILGLYSIQHPEPRPHPMAKGNPSSRDARKSTLEPLTPREKAVAVAIAEGKTSAEIIAALGIRDSTFRSYVKSIYRKTGTHSRTELTRVIMGHK